MDTMRVRLLVAQRREDYEGQFGPEVLAAVDEYTDSDNPDYFINEVAAQRSAIGDDAEATAIITVQLPLAVVMEALRPRATVTPISVSVDETTAAPPVVEMVEESVPNFYINIRPLASETVVARWREIVSADAAAEGIAVELVDASLFDSNIASSVRYRRGADVTTEDARRLLNNAIYKAIREISDEESGRNSAVLILHLAGEIPDGFAERWIEHIRSSATDRIGPVTVERAEDVHLLDEKASRAGMNRVAATVTYGGRYENADIHDLGLTAFIKARGEHFGERASVPYALDAYPASEVAR